jgi:hypothetical protein
MNMFRHAALAVAAGLLLNAPLHAQDASTATPQTVAPLSAHSPDADSQTLFVQDGKSVKLAALSEREMTETKGGFYGHGAVSNNPWLSNKPGRPGKPSSNPTCTSPGCVVIKPAWNRQ